MRSPKVDIRDVPCGRCQRGYGKLHVCEEPRHCVCDQEANHLPGPSK